MTAGQAAKEAERDRDYKAVITSRERAEFTEAEAAEMLGVTVGELRTLDQLRRHWT